MITAEEIHEILTSDPDPLDVSLAAVSEAVDTLDQQAIYTEERSRLTVEEWDQSSPINNTPASEILEKRHVPGGAYFIYRDGKMMYFQTTRYGVSGHQPIEDPIEDGQAHADYLAERMARQKIIDVVADIATDPTATWAAAREERNNLLSESDWAVFPDVPLTDTEKQEVKDYRTELRDIPQTYDEPYNVEWPSKPSCLE